MKNLTPSYMVMCVSAGAVVHECIREATIRALTDDIQVRFTHNDHLYIVMPSNIIEGKSGFTVDGVRGDANEARW